MSIKISFKHSEDFIAAERISNLFLLSGNQEDEERKKFQKSLISPENNNNTSENGDDYFSNVSPLYSDFLTKYRCANEYNDKNPKTKSVLGIVDPSTNDMISMKRISAARTDAHFSHFMKRKEEREERDRKRRDEEKKKKKQRMMLNPLIIPMSEDDQDDDDDEAENKGQNGQEEEKTHSSGKSRKRNHISRKSRSKNPSATFSVTSSTMMNATSKSVITLQDLKWPSRIVESPLHPNELPISADAVTAGAVPFYAPALLCRKSCANHDRDGYFDLFTGMAVPVGFDDIDKQRKTLLISMMAGRSRSSGFDMNNKKKNASSTTRPSSSSSPPSQQHHRRSQSGSSDGSSVPSSAACSSSAGGRTRKHQQNGKRRSNRSREANYNNTHDDFLDDYGVRKKDYNFEISPARAKPKEEEETVLNESQSDEGEEEEEEIEEGDE